MYRALPSTPVSRTARRRRRSRRRGAVDGARPRHRRSHRGRRRRARRDHGVVRRRAGGAAQPRRRHPHARRLRATERPRRPGAARPRDVGEARRRRRAGPRSARALRRRVAARAPARRRRPAPCSCRATPGPGTSCSRTGRSPASSTGSSRTSATRWTTGRGSTCGCPTRISSGLQERYSRATGIEIDHERIRYYRAAVDYRCAVTTSLAVSRGGGARGWAPYLLVTERYVLGLADRMAGLLGIVGSGGAAGRDSTAAHGLLRPSARRDPCRHARRRRRRRCRESTRNLQILVHYLRAYDEIGAEIEALDRADRAATLGADALDESRFAELVEQAGADGRRDAVPLPVRRTQRERALVGDPARPPRRCLTRNRRQHDQLHTW